MIGKRIYQCFPIPLNQRTFDPDVYLTKEVITYPKMNVDTGTSDSKNSSFPTLVRAVDEGAFVPPLDVIYPYFCKDPWAVKPCDEKSMYDRMEIASCKIKPPATAIFGYTIRNKEVYALNTNKITNIDVRKFRKTMVALLSKEEKESTNEQIRCVINSALENIETYKYIAKGTSDEYGYFGIGPLQLEYNTTTSIAVICEWQPGEYEVVIRDVDTKFYGACIVQDNFEFKYGGGSGYTVTLPASFSPPASLSGHVKSFGGSVHSIFPIYNKYKYGTTQDTVYYSYCVNEYTVKEDTINKWVRIGPTGYIWAEIDEIDLSYLFDFEVTKAYIIPKINPNKPLDNLNVCGDTSGSKIELEVIFPKPDDPDDIKREHLLPNCVLLKSSEPYGFFNEDWSLFIEYKYRKLETHKADATSTTVWPSDLDGENSINKFVDPPFSLSAADGGGIKVENIRYATIAIMAYIQDDDFRIQSAVATKMLTDVVTTRCRPVEIFYAYIADATEYNLIPHSGFFTRRGGDQPIGTIKHSNRPKCGDHDCNPRNCIGPMWYPFNDCTSIDFYNWYTGAASCTLPIEGQGGPLGRQPRYDWRYCMAHEYKGLVISGHNWASACGTDWYYSYSKAGDSVFNGSSKIRTSVYLESYRRNGWTPPPFGNDGREITERWLSQEHYGFWDLSGVRPVPKSEYMPLVFDDEMLFTSFNAFDEKGRIGPIDDCLHTTCMLNCMLSNVISESIQDIYTDVKQPPETARFRFEDLFRVINHAWCMYPPPIGEGPGDSVTARRYSFNSISVNEKETVTYATGSTKDFLVPVDKEVAWAWREYWKDIERQTRSSYGDYALSTMLFNFVEFNRPEYYFDSEKTEHRLITDEGEIEIVFTAPILEEANEEGDYKYPEISIRGGIPRKFEIIYDLYDSEQVEWMDEGGDGTEGSSGGEEEKSIYEEAMGDDWFHDENTIFDENASADKSDDRKIVLLKDELLGDTYAWYNRGLIANIPKDRLTYLPYEVEKPIGFTSDIPPDSESPTYLIWYNDSLFEKEIIFSPKESTACFVLVEFNGRMGIKRRGDGSSMGGDADYWVKEGIYCDPAVKAAECSVGDEFPCPDESGFPPTVIYEYEGEKGDKYEYSSYESYSLYGELPTTPKRMLFPAAVFKVRLTLFKKQHLILRKFESGSVMRGQPAKYVDAVEPIKVWEQKYITSTGEFGDKNPDGPDSFDLRSFDRDLKNAGQYFPTGINSTNSDSMKCRDKMTMIGTGKQHYEDISLSISKGNLKIIEREEQPKLYNDAYSKDTYDDMTYSIILPPNIQQFLATIGMDLTALGENCKFTSEKLEFTKHVATIDFNQDYDFWSPGGHYFRWSSDYYRTMCRVLSPIVTIYFPEVVHYKHCGGVVPWNPHQAYVGWSKYYYYRGTLVQGKRVEKQIRSHPVWGAAGGGFVMDVFH
jgi:hypothetical protein